MKRRLRHFRQRLAHLAFVLSSFVGPVANAVKGELSKEERVRSLGVAAVYYVTTSAGLWATLKRPETLTDCLVPLTIAAMGGLLDAASRWHDGVPKSPGTEPTEPAK